MDSSSTDFTILRPKAPNSEYYEPRQMLPSDDVLASTVEGNTIQLPNATTELFIAVSPAPVVQDEEDVTSVAQARQLQEVADDVKAFLDAKREKYQQLAVLRKHRLREMTVFIAFLILVCIVAMLARSTMSSSMQSRSMHDFLAEEGHSSSNKSNLKLNLAGQGAFDDVREWLQSVFHRRLYSGNGGAVYYSHNSARLLPILGNSMIVGSVQVRQLRLKTHAVGSSGCHVPSMIARLNPSCYPEFNAQNEETDALSEYLTLWETQNKRSASKDELPWAWWTPHSSSFQSSYIYSHFGIDYPNGGYILKMPKDPEAGRLALANLYLDQAPMGWLKSNTSAALLTEWVMYNPNTQLFHTYTTLFENRLAGGIPSETFRSINLERFSNNAGTVAITAGVEVSLFAFILFYIVIEARNIHRLGFKAWVTDGYSLLMATIICLFIAVIVIEIMLFVATSEIMATKNFQTIEIRELSHVIYYTQAVLDIYSVICLLSWFRFGKYLDVISPKTKMLSETVARSAPDIAYFLILFFCVFMGFVTAFQTGFGDRIFEFRTFKQSCVGTFRAVLQDFDYDAFKSANAILGPILIVFFIFVTLFLLVEMFLGIVMANYEEVLDDLEQEEEDLPSHLRAIFKKRAQMLSIKFMSCLNRNKVVPEPILQQSLSIQQMLKFYDDSREIFQSAGFKSAAELQEVVENSQGDFTVEEIHAFAKMRDKDKSKEQQLASTAKNLNHILAVANKVEEELQHMKSLILV